MNYGLIEIGNITAKAPSDAIRKLKSILDRHRIYHIVDGVAFFHPQGKTFRSGEIHRARAGGRDRFKFRQLIVPDLYKLDHMSITFFDSREADFLATLIYEAH